jgi:hypothetical protein
MSSATKMRRGYRRPSLSLAPAAALVTERDDEAGEPDEATGSATAVEEDEVEAPVSVRGSVMLPVVLPLASLKREDEMLESSLSLRRRTCTC